MKNTPKEIKFRREKVMILLSHGYSQGAMADELQVSRKTINFDVQFINELNQKAMFDMAKSSFATMYMNCNDGMNEILYECWKTYKNEDNDPEITYTVRMAALKLAGDIYQRKMAMFENGPATMQLGRMHDKLEELRRGALSEENVFTQRYLSSSPQQQNKDVNLDDLGK